MRIRRTLLWVNGNDSKKLQKGIESNADAIVLELEDMCPEQDKEVARYGAVEALMKRNFKGKERGVRINSLDSPWGKEDLKAIVPCIPNFIRLPKCESVASVLYYNQVLNNFEHTHNLPQNTIELILVIETPKGIINAYHLASCCKRVTGIGLGAGDLTSAMGVDRDLTIGSTQLMYAKQKLVMDAKAANVQVYDTTIVCQEDKLEELNEFIREDTKNIKRLGFTGRSVSMLPQVDIINEVFTPTQEEVERARKIVKGYKEGMKAGQSEIFVDGMFLDPPIVNKAQCIIDYMDKLRNQNN